MKLDEMYPRKIISHSDLSTPTTVKIVRISSGEFRPNGTPVKRWLIHFTPAIKGMNKAFLPKALAVQIKNILGSDETAHWHGGEITLYSAQLPSSRKRGVRAKRPTPQDTPPAPPPATPQTDTDLVAKRDFFQLANQCVAKKLITSTEVKELTNMNDWEMAAKVLANKLSDNKQTESH